MLDAGEVPAIVIFISRFVIAISGIFLSECFAVSRALGHMIDTTIRVKHRDTELGEADMVRAVEVTRRRVCIGLDPHAAWVQHIFKTVFQFRATVTDHDYVLGLANGLDRVDINSRNGLLQRDEWA